ncbi:MAG TPA: thioesterase family protein [Sandaracinaceae bacterium LLY-WYZ-13_1]|nr:thioesterase family protein [Sandaracinaceae bacterium LLY-WYZ-13_1]
MTPVPFETASRFAPEGAGRYVGVLTADWVQGRGVYGGMVAAILARAAAAEVDADRPPRAFTIAFCAPAPPGEAEARVSVERRGGSVTQVSARLLAGGAVLATAQATFAGPRRASLRFDERAMPELPDPASVARGPDALYIPPFCQHFDLRQALGPAPFSGGGRARIGGWCRLRDAGVPDLGMIVAAMDAWAPAVLGRVDRWTPAASVDLSVQLLADTPLEAAPDAWYAFEARGRHAADGYADEEAVLWTAAGRPVAVARQLVAVFE